MMSSVIPSKLLYQSYQKSSKLRCHVCPKACILFEGETGYCGIRLHIEGIIVSKIYGLTTGLALDPIEKKPLYHYLPGTDTLSLGGIGCNLACLHCQNASTSQERHESAVKNLEKAPPEKVVQTCLNNQIKSISVTYNEPTINTEYLVDIANLAHNNGIKLIVVSNGFLTRPLAKFLGKYIDAANIDLKGGKSFYREICDGRLTPVKHCIEEWYHSGVHLEITTLIIPELNDDLEFIKETILWIQKNLSSSIPLHFSRYYPQYKMRDHPPTSISTLLSIRQFALDLGMKFVYTGNIKDDESGATYCQFCLSLLINRGHGSLRRKGYKTDFVNYDSDKNVCTNCSKPAPFSV